MPLLPLRTAYNSLVLFAFHVRFVRSGLVGININDSITWRTSGLYGYIRSRKAADFGSTTDDNVSKTDTLLFDATSIRALTAQQERRFYAFSFRCLSTAVEGEEKR